ncbi:MAG: hypothetical protein KAT61_05065, partial [Gammaproteobacteria bacterium]|nr:hypothetical protein [Gammaproteobacteria bacterium]
QILQEQISVIPVSSTAASLLLTDLQLHVAQSTYLSVSYLFTVSARELAVTETVVKTLAGDKFICY